MEDDKLNQEENKTVENEEAKPEKYSAFGDFIKHAKTFAEDNKLQEKFETLKEKTNEAVEGASKKIDELKHDEDLKAKLNNVKESVVSATNKVVDKVKENEELTEKLTQVKDTAVDATKKSVDFVSTKVDEFRNDPEVQEKFEKAKDKTIEVAEKAVNSLKKWLKPEKAESTEEAAEESTENKPE